MCKTCGDSKHIMGAKNIAKEHNLKSKMAKVNAIKGAMNKAKK